MARRHAVCGCAVPSSGLRLNHLAILCDGGHRSAMAPPMTIPRQVMARADFPARAAGDSWCTPRRRARCACEAGAVVTAGRRCSWGVSLFNGFRVQRGANGCSLSPECGRACGFVVAALGFSLGRHGCSQGIAAGGGEVQGVEWVDHHFHLRVQLGPCPPAWRIAGFDVAFVGAQH